MLPSHLVKNAAVLVKKEEKVGDAEVEKGAVRGGGDVLEVVLENYLLKEAGRKKPAATECCCRGRY